MVENLDKKILSTICYYKALDYPVTAFEIWKYLIEIKQEKKDGQDEIKLGDVLIKLEDLRIKRFISTNRGMYFLRGNEYLVNQRVKRDKLSNLKIKKLRNVVWFLRCMPFIRMIAITGRLAMKNARVNSDWDVLVVLKEGRIWIGRTVVTLFVHILGKRRYGRKTTDRVCLNYFITTNSLEIKNKDLFSANEYFFCMPIFDTKNYFEKFQLRNKWIRKYKPNYYLSNTRNLKAVADTVQSKFLRKIFEKIFDWDFLEKYLEKIEKAKIERNPKTQKEEGLIVANKNTLIFLPEPQGPKVFEKFKENINKLSA